MLGGSVDLPDDVQRQVFLVLVGEVYTSSSGAFAVGVGLAPGLSTSGVSPAYPVRVPTPHACLLTVDLTGAFHGLP